MEWLKRVATLWDWVAGEERGTAYDIRGMGKRELIAREPDRLPKRDLDKLLAFLRAIHEMNSDAAIPLLAAETSLAKDWLSPEEDSAWASL